MRNATSTMLAAGAALVSSLLVLPGSSGAATPWVAIRYAADITTEFGGQIFDDGDAIEEEATSTIVPLSIGAVPNPPALSAYHVRAGGIQLVSFETSVVLPGGLVASPGDVVQTNFDGSAPYTMVFDASTHGVPDGARVDAIAYTSNVGGDLLLSFDTTVTLGAITAADEDIVRVIGASYSLFFDASSAGVSSALDLDGATWVPANGSLLVSFDTGGTIGGVTFADEDVLEYTAVGTWEMLYDGSAQQPTWPPADLRGADVLTDLDIDGLADEFETNTGAFVSTYDTGTDPLNPDSDGDGVNDGDEVALGTDPNAAPPPPSIPTLGRYGTLILIAGLALAGVWMLRRRRLP